MQADESTALNRRVTDLETEVQELRRRVAVLEGAGALPRAAAAASVVPAAPPIAAPHVPAPRPPEPAPAPARPAAVPPPIPAPARVAAPAPAPATPPRTAVPPAPPAAAPRAAIAEHGPSALRELLGALHLLPPTGRGSGEAQIGAWWATRIGALLAVIGVVFFGVYISLGTPPWVKLAELAAIAGGVTLGGLWLERRMERLGAVVAGSGLALAYFTAFAAYAVPAVKVVESVAAGALLQGLAVLAIGGAALWRRSATVGTMAVLLGFVSAFFSMAAGFDDFAVVAGLGLAAMAVFFRHREGWVAPVIASAVLAHVLIAVVAVEIWSTEAGRRGAVFGFGIVGAAFGLHLLSLILEGGGTDGHIARAQRWIQSLNTSLAVMAGFAAALQVMPHDRLSWYFFGAGAVLAGAAGWAWRAVPRDGIFAMFAVKAASLIALGVITHWDARTRWIALAVQAAVLMAAAVRTRRVALAVAAVLAWVVSLLFFGDDVAGLRGTLVSADGAAVALYLAGGAALLAWVANWLRDRTPEAAPGAGAAWILGPGAAVPVVLTLDVVRLEPWAAVACVLAGVALAALARVFRSIVPVFGAVVAMLAAHAFVQVFEEAAWGRGWLWSGAILVAACSGALAWPVGARAGERSASWRGAAIVLMILTLATLGGATMQTVASYPALAATMVFAVAGVAAGGRLGREDLALAGLLGVPAAFGLHVFHYESNLALRGPAAWLWLAAAGAPAALALARISGGTDRVIALARGLAAATGVLLAWAAAKANLGPLGTAWSLLGAAAVYGTIGYWRASVVSRGAASAILALAAMYFLARTRWAAGADAWALLVAVFSVLVALAAAPLVPARDAADARPGRLGRAWRVAHAIAAAWGLCLVATVPQAVWKSHGSVVLALGGVALFVLGLVLRARSHRIAGLVVLGLCIGRVFIYDIQSTQYRIAAFVVLGVLLLVVGFSYQRFRHLIEGTPADRKDDGPDGDRAP